MVTGRDVDHSSLFKLRYKFGRKRPTRGGKKEKPPLTVQDLQNPRRLKWRGTSQLPAAKTFRGKDGLIEMRAVIDNTELRQRRATVTEKGGE
jgi:hypothetical protein